MELLVQISWQGHYKEWLLRMKVNFQIGDLVEMKKPHPCGNKVWEILRVGMDFRIKCINCERSVLLSREKFEKGFKKFADPK